MEPPSESITCAACAHENPFGAVFCRECGTPIGATCNLDPYHQIFSQGDLFRRAAMGNPEFIAFLDMWIIFLPYPLSFFAGGDRPLPQRSPAYLGFLMWIVGGVILYRVTSNYLRKRGLDSEFPGEKSGSV